MFESGGKFPSFVDKRSLYMHAHAPSVNMEPRFTAALCSKNCRLYGYFWGIAILYTKLIRLVEAFFASDRDTGLIELVSLKVSTET